MMRSVAKNQSSEIMNYEIMKSCEVLNVLWSIHEIVLEIKSALFKYFMYIELYCLFIY